MANPPPPYDNITGISRAVMKDNAQTTLANYNGNARPGELVVNLETNPPALYVGNNAGQLTAITSGGSAGLPLANGTSNFNIATVNSNATVTVAGSSTWTFDTAGNLTIPGRVVGQATILIDNRATGNTADINLFSADDITLQARDRTLGSDIEGGDINIFAGDGSPDDAGGGTGSGGDVQIIGGVGGLADISSGGQGGFVRLDAGRGGDGSATANAGRGGDTYVSAGEGGVVGGLGGGGGGNVYITAGDTTDATQDRGSVYLFGGGGGDDTTVGGYVQISIPAAGTSPGGNWTFTGSGRTLEPPPDAEIFNPSVGNLTLGTVGSTIVRNIDGVTTYDWVFGNTGTLTAPGPMQLAVYANATVRDSSITSPQPGMMIYVTGTGMQIYGATQWNTVTGSGT